MLCDLVEHLEHRAPFIYTRFSVTYYVFERLRHGWKDLKYKILLNMIYLFSSPVFVIERGRPIWVLVERTMLHFTWRASKVGWRGHLSTAPAQVAVLCQDLLNLSLLNYAAVRS